MRPEEQLIKAGLKVTAPRLQVLQVFLANEDAHYTAECVYVRMMSQGVGVARSTIYRVLTQLTEVGILSRSSFVSPTAVYQLCRDKPRDHIVCLDCGAVVEFSDEVVEQRLQAVVADSGFSFARRQLTIHGFCPKCRASN